MDTSGPSVLKASPDQMVCSRQPWTSHTRPPFLIKTGNCPTNCAVKITICHDAKPVVHVPRKCPIVMWPLVYDKLDEFIDQGIIIPVEEATDWVSSLAYSWKVMGNYESGPKGSQYSYETWSLQNPYCGRDHPWTGWKHLLHQASWNLILPVHSPQLWVITAHDLQHTMGKVQICLSPLGPSLYKNIFQWMMDQILTNCNGVIGITDEVVVHGKNDKEHDKSLHKFMSHPWAWACLQQG